MSCNGDGSSAAYAGQYRGSRAALGSRTPRTDPVARRRRTPPSPASRRRCPSCHRRIAPTIPRASGPATARSPGRAWRRLEGRSPILGRLVARVPSRSHFRNIALTDRTARHASGRFQVIQAIGARRPPDASAPIPNFPRNRGAHCPRQRKTGPTYPTPRRSSARRPARA